MGSEIIPIVGLIVFWAWVAWLLLEWRKLKHKSDMQKKIVDKFSTVQEFNNFLQSEEGRKFLSFLKFNGFGLREKIQSSLSKGIIGTILGISIIAVGKFFPVEAKYFSATGIIIIALGVGFLVSTVVSYNLSSKWGLFED